MTTIATFSIDDALPGLHSEYLYTADSLVKNPLAQPFAADFQPVGVLLDAAIKTQGGLDDAAVLAAAGRDAADAALDPIMIRIIATLLIITHDNRDDPLYLSYAAGQTGAEIVRPMLGAELETAGEWVTDLAKESEPSLLPFAVPLKAAFDVGAAAEADVKAADKALSTFRLTGERKVVVDAFNAARARLFGKLLEFQHAHPELRLPADWAAGFFRHAVKASKYGTTAAQVQAYLAKLEDDKATAIAYLAELNAKTAAKDKARADRAAARVALAAARKDAREKKKDEKALAVAAKKPLPK